LLEAEVLRPASNRLSNDHMIKEINLQDPRASHNSFSELQIRFGRTRGV
jgi:hypothetical protein